MRAWRGFFCLVVPFLFALAACGDDDSGPGVPVGGDDGGPHGPDGGDDAATMMTGGRGGHGGGGGNSSVPEDAGPDAMPFNPFADAGGGTGGVRAPMMTNAGPVPKAWTCPDALWADAHCDCGCSATDFDCKAFSCIDPGCVEGACEACFTLSGSWKPCEPDPDMADWSCDPLAISDGLCDCGCNIPDPDCKGSGCTGPGCRKQACDVRHGCSAEMIAANDDCSSANPKVLTDGDWKCPWDRYASGDGCDCGCGAVDPDCGPVGGCTGPRCFENSCSRCADEVGRPYDCDAAKAGWDEDISGNGTTPSLCNSVHFGTGDGCDCGCGGHDPDCGKNKGCEAAGCTDSACNRCTDPSGAPTGCPPIASASTWVDDNGCSADNFGTGDGCDCGCGIPDPDCAGKGTTAAPFNDACDVCHDHNAANAMANRSYVVPCPKWTCGTITDPAFDNPECDCGCGAIDPYCRGTNHKSCTKEGCEIATCEFCNDGSNRTACGGDWTSNPGGDPLDNACLPTFYDLDGLCDCGCGAHDPDCVKGQDCVDKGCVAPDCDVCHAGSLLTVCYQWTCDADLFDKDGKCDCGCGAIDPDCGAAHGCQEPGCKDAACKTCHDPFGRVLPCP